MLQDCVDTGSTLDEMSLGVCELEELLRQMRAAQGVCKLEGLLRQRRAAPSPTHDFLEGEEISLSEDVRG